MDPWLLFIISSNIPDDAASSKEPAEKAVNVEDVNRNIEQEEVKDDGEGNSMVGDVSLCKYSLVISLEKAGES